MSSILQIQSAALRLAKQVPPPNVKDECDWINWFHQSLCDVALNIRAGARDARRAHTQETRAEALNRAPSRTASRGLGYATTKYPEEAGMLAAKRMYKRDAPTMSYIEELADDSGTEYEDSDDEEEEESEVDTVPPSQPYA